MVDKWEAQRARIDATEEQRRRIARAMLETFEREMNIEPTPGSAGRGMSMREALDVALKDHWRDFLPIIELEKTCADLIEHDKQKCNVTGNNRDACGCWMCRQRNATGVDEPVETRRMERAPKTIWEDFYNTDPDDDLPRPANIVAHIGKMSTTDLDNLIELALHTNATVRFETDGNHG
jgi:hypothetical protein